MYQKPQSYEVQFLRYGVTIFFAILAYFCLPPNNPKKQKFWKNKTSIWRCHHFKLVQQKTQSNDICLLRYEVYQKWQSYDIWFLRYQLQQTDFFVILDHSLLFYPTIDPNIKIWKKCKKHLEILSFYTCA